MEFAANDIAVLLSAGDGSIFKDGKFQWRTRLTDRLAVKEQKGRFKLILEAAQIPTLVGSVSIIGFCCVKLCAW